MFGGQGVNWKNQGIYSYKSSDCLGCHFTVFKWFVKSVYLSTQKFVLFLSFSSFFVFFFLSLKNYADLYPERINNCAGQMCEPMGVCVWFSTRTTAGLFTKNSVMFPALLSSGYLYCFNSQRNAQVWAVYISCTLDMRLPRRLRHRRIVLRYQNHVVLAGAPSNIGKLLRTPSNLRWFYQF